MNPWTVRQCLPLCDECAFCGGRDAGVGLRTVWGIGSRTQRERGVVDLHGLDDTSIAEVLPENFVRLTWVNGRLALVLREADGRLRVHGVPSHAPY